MRKRALARLATVGTVLLVFLVFGVSVPLSALVLGFIFYACGLR